jgi:hypothetical protein
MLYIATHKNRLVQIGRLLAIIMLISLWLKYFFNYEVFAATSMMIGVLFTAVVTAHTLAFIIKSETVTGEVIYAAMLVYLWLKRFQFLKPLSASFI